MRALTARPITSRDNPLFKSLAALARSAREGVHAGQVLLDGAHLVAAYLEHVGVPQRMVVSASALGRPEIARLLADSGAKEPAVLSDALFKRISQVATPQGILAVARKPALPPAGDREFCVALEDIQDPGNLGSILRSAAAAGARHVLLSKGCAQAWSPKVTRAAMGAHFLLAIHERVDLAAFLRRYRGRVVAAGGHGARSVFAADLTGNIALLFGNEGAGLSRTLLVAADEVVAIPMPGGTESLNVGAAAAVCLFERVRQSGAMRSDER